MTTRITLTIPLLAIATAASIASTQTGGPYRLSWTTIDGGGGTSTGGPYSISGTIGQPDSDWSRGGDYEVLGGFWPGGPLCTVQFDDFAKFAELLWLNDSGADLNEDAELDFADVAWFMDYWLGYCPYEWPFR